jgi:hypothetical protein
MTYLPHRIGRFRPEYLTPSRRASSYQNSSGNVRAHSWTSSAMNAWSLSWRARFSRIF